MPWKVLAIGIPNALSQPAAKFLILVARPCPTTATARSPQTLTLVLVAGTCLAFYLCYRLAVPFLPALAWVVALAIVAHPLHAWLESKLTRPGLAAGLSVAVVAGLLIGPALFVISRIVRQLAVSVQELQSGVDSTVARSPSIQPIATFLQAQSLPQQSKRLCNPRWPACQRF